MGEKRVSNRDIIVRDVMVGERKKLGKIVDIGERIVRNIVGYIISVTMFRSRA